VKLFRFFYDFSATVRNFQADFFALCSEKLEKLFVFFTIPIFCNSYQSYGCILKANLSWTLKSRTRVMQNNFHLCLYLSFLHLKPAFSYSSLSFVRLNLG